MKKINKILSVVLSLAMVFSLAIALGTTTVKAADDDFKIDPAGTLTKYVGDRTDIEIPSGVKTIGEKAFAGNKNISKVTMPNSVKVIKKSAFDTCANLKKVTLSNKLTTIEDNAFYGCDSLTTISLPNSLETVGFSAFCNCKSLTGIYIPKNVKEIASYAFGYNMIGGYTQTPGFMVMGEGNAQLYAQKYSFPFATLKDIAIKPVSLKKASKTQAKLTWKKNEKVDKIQIQVSTKKNFSTKKTYSEKFTNAKDTLIPSLKKGNTYYVRMRGTKEIAGTTYNSKWSKTMKITMK